MKQAIYATLLMKIQTNGQLVDMSLIVKGSNFTDESLTNFKYSIP